MEKDIWKENKSRAKEEIEALAKDYKDGIELIHLYAMMFKMIMEKLTRIEKTLERWEKGESERTN